MGYWEYFLFFLFEDCDPLSGPVRIIFYSGLLFLVAIAPISRPPYGESPMHSPKLYKVTLKGFGEVHGCLRLLGTKWITVGRLYLIRNITFISWICCILGFGGQLPPILAGCGFLILSLILAGYIGTNHRWLAPVYAMFCLIFVNGNINYSLDSYFSKLYPNLYPFVPPTSGILRSGFACKLYMWAACWTLVGAGYSKVYNGGLRWMDGRSIKFYTSLENGYSPLLKIFLQQNLWFCALLSIATVVVEFVAILVCFQEFNILRLPASIVLSGFHIGIWLTMTPNYWPQTLGYVLMINWSDFFPSIQALRHPNILSTIPSYQRDFIILFFLIISFFLAAVNFLRWDYWPFTSIPMYSFYRGSDFSNKSIKDKKQLQLLCDEYLNNPYNGVIGWTKWPSIEIKEISGSKIVQIDTIFRHPSQGLHVTLLRRMLCFLVVKEFTHQKSGIPLFKIFLNHLPKYTEIKEYTWLGKEKNKIAVTLYLKLGGKKQPMLKWEGYIPKEGKNIEGEILTYQLTD